MSISSETHGEADLLGEIKIHRKKVKNIRIRVETDASVHISVPMYYSQQNINEIVERNSGWIASRRSQMRQLSSNYHPVAEDEVFYRGDVWKNIQQCSLSGRVLVDESLKIIKTSVPLKGKSLVKWYGEQSKFYIPAKLRELAAKHGFEYSKVSVRALRRKWGSWRTDGVITLNAKLILAPDEVCEAIMLHELVHTKHPNHSKDFWKVLYSICPNWDSSSAWLKKYHHFMEQLWAGE